MISNLSADHLGRHLFKKYFNAFESVIEIVKGIERIWWAIRKGYSGIPRNRDYSTCHLFKNLKLTSLDDTLERWDDCIVQLKESFDSLKLNNNNNSDEKCIRIISITLNIFKKIKLNHLRSISIKQSDDLQDNAVEIVQISKESTRLLLINQSNPFLCTQMYSLNGKLHLLTDFITMEGSESKGWFEVNLKEIDEICESLSLMHPTR